MNDESFARGVDSESDARPLHAGRKMRVLLVEDERLIRLALAHQLARAGYEVIAARTAEEALELAGDDVGRIDYLITDIDLPHLSGLGLVDELRTRGLACPMLAMSALPGDEAMEGVRHRRGLEFLAKPFRESELLACVAQGLARGTAH
jgi:DNA-binding response OmpR family regulator